MLALLLLPVAAAVPAAAGVLGPTVEVSVPEDVAVGAPPEAFVGSATNSSGGTLEDVRYRFEIVGPADLEPADLVIGYDTGTETGEIPLVAGDTAGTLIGYFGPAQGFDFPSGVTLDTDFTVAARGSAPLGQVTVTTAVVDLADAVLGQPDEDLTTIVAPEIGIDLPDEFIAGGDPVTYVGTATNSTNSDYPAVRFDFVLDGPEGLTAADLVIEYEDASNAGSWLPLPLTDAEDGTITGTFGPAGGFPFPADADNATTFRVAVAPDAPTGELTLSSSLVTVEAGDPVDTIATAEDTTTIVAGTATISFTPPEDLGAGAPAEEFTGTLTNDTGTTIDPGRIDFTITGPEDLEEGDAVLEHDLDGDDEFEAIPLTVVDGALVGSFPGDAGIAIPTGEITVAFRVAAGAGAPLGEYTTEAELVVVGSEDPPLASASGTSEVLAPSLTIDLPERLELGDDPVEFGGTLTNDTGSDYPAVRIDYLLSGPEGLEAADLTVEWRTSDDAPFEPVTLTDTEDGIVGSSNVVPLPDGATVDATFRMSVAEDAPTGDLEVAVDLVTVDGETTATIAGFSGTTEIAETSVAVITTTTAAVFPEPARTGNPVLLLAQVETGGEEIPTGSVTFTRGATVLGEADLNAEGIAQLVVDTGFPLGDITFTATYNPDEGFVGSSDDHTFRSTPPDLTGRFIDAAYRIVMGRPVDPVGLNGWRQALNSGSLTPAQFAAALLGSPERRARTCNQLYTEVLGRNADTLGRNACVAQLAQGVTYSEISAQLAGSPENFARSGGTNSGFVDRLYQRALGRTPDAGGKAAFLAQLAAGRSRLDVARDIYFSRERHVLVVRFSYGVVLGRQPDATGLRGWTDFLQAGGHEEILLALLVGSPEFLQRRTP